MQHVARWTMIGLMILVPFASRGGAEHGWPVENVNADHPLGNTLGEFVANQSPSTTNVPAPYRHEGIDILVEPYSEESGPEDSAPYAVVTVRGTVVRVDMVENSQDNYIRIRGAVDNLIYLYHHLEYASLSWPLEEHFNETPAVEPGEDPVTDPSNWPLMKEGDRIAKIRNAFACDYDHLHYEVQRREGNGDITMINPLTHILPMPDVDKPDVVGIHLAKRAEERWSEIVLDDTPGACTIVNGELDVIAQVRDRDAAGSDLAGARNVGVYNLQWRACKASSPNCQWKTTQLLDEMPGKWTNSDNKFAQVHFSTTTPWQTTPEPWLSEAQNCPTNANNKTFMVLTTEASWDTLDDRFPNGKYILSVKAGDFAGLEDTESISVCVQN